MNEQAPAPQASHSSAPTLETLLEALQAKRRIPVMSLAEALQELHLMDRATIVGLQGENPKLLGMRCRELVVRGLLTREQLGRALARMTGLADIDTIDPERAPPLFLRLLLEPRRPAPMPRLEPARSIATLLDALEALHHAPIVTLRQALEELRLLDPAMIAKLAADDPDVFRGHRIQLVRRAVLTRDELGRALGRVAGIPEADATRFDLAPGAFEVLPHKLARTLRVLPLGPHDDVYFMASGSPDDAALRKTLCEATGSTVMLVWADSNDVVARVEREETARFAAGQEPEMLEWTLVVPQEQRLEPDDVAAPALEDLVALAEKEVDAVLDRGPATVVGEQSGMARLVKKMVMDARSRRASDIHIETNPHGAGTLVRMRIDGDLCPYLTLPGKLRAALVSRIKVMARLDISERRRPQDGKIDFAEFGGERLELRVAILPTHDGMENVVLRLLGTSAPMALAHLGLQPRDEATIQRLSKRSFGLMLAAGPTGSGKTTTLHSILKAINTEERKIWTAEDPIEITQPGLNQVQVKPEIGLTFAAAMRSFLRADPDVIMIGEIRDAETAKIGIEASLTGHLVLSTLHTNNACESVVRLLELGIDPLNFADSLLCIVAQRLVRALCPACRQLEALGDGAYAALLEEYVDQGPSDRAEAERRLLDAAGAASPSALRVGVACGCDACGGTGYKGRLGVYEVLENTPALRELIQQRARPSQLLASAVQSGMHSLRHDAIEKVLQGRLDMAQARAAYT
ncbi:GspE/PulE family protein [Caenimonas sedimenti]|nr:GspE/PulE family protein [Caenimonas sedimenti]